MKIQTEWTDVVSSSSGFMKHPLSEPHQFSYATSQTLSSSPSLTSFSLFVLPWVWWESLWPSLVFIFSPPSPQPSLPPPYVSLSSSDFPIFYPLVFFLSFSRFSKGVLLFIFSPFCPGITPFIFSQSLVSLIFLLLHFPPRLHCFFLVFPLCLISDHWVSVTFILSAIMLKTVGFCFISVCILKPVFEERQFQEMDTHHAGRQHKTFCETVRRF